MMPEIQNRKDSNESVLPGIYALTLRVLSQRTMAYIALAVTAAGYGYVLYDPNLLRIGVISVWSLFIYVTGIMRGNIARGA